MFTKNQKDEPENYKYTCQSCKQHFANDTGLREHCRVHENNGVPCTYCGITFQSYQELKAHSVIHTAGSPYICNECGRGFRQNHSLRDHGRIHSGEKPYQCTVCNKTFRVKNNLRVHQRTHTGEKPYQCAICNKKFTQKGSLNNHLKNIHNKNNLTTTTKSTLPIESNTCNCSPNSSFQSQSTKSLSEEIKDQTKQDKKTKITENNGINQNYYQTQPFKPPLMQQLNFHNNMEEIVFNPLAETKLDLYSPFLSSALQNNGIHAHYPQEHSGPTNLYEKLSFADNSNNNNNNMNMPAMTILNHDINNHYDFNLLDNKIFDFNACNNSISYGKFLQFVMENDPSLLQLYFEYMLENDNVNVINR